MKIALITAMWRRPKIYELFAAGVYELKYHFPDIDFQVFVAGSEGLGSRLLAEYFDHNYIEYPNQPLGIKMNAAAMLAKTFNPHYVILLGSDDIIGKSLMEQYLVHMKERIGYIYTLDCYFYDTATKK
ncbi:MAG: hypothetical protein JNM00_06910, partial [Flavobacteriales bacterium]|nr:hypothetical protein [Flavobacteriales bacterium]